MANTRDEEKKTSLQEREAHRYYQPWLDAHGSSLNVASHVESIAQHALRGSGYLPQASRDKALISFAQLAVLRLNVNRGMVSLLDSTQQYILAEATRSSFTGRDDEIWLGSTILSRPDAVCEHCLHDSCTASNDDGEVYTCKGVIVNDLRMDDRFRDRPYVVQEPGVRFYAGVPIISRAGQMIGVYAVSDNKTRHGLRVDELKFMQQIAQAVMEHLEWARDRVDRFKGERIVRAMAAFIANTSSADSSLAREIFSPAAGPASSPSPRPKPQSEPPTTQHSAGQTPTVQTSAAKPSVPPKADKLSKMFDRAAEALRESTLADGAVIFGAAVGALSGFPGMRGTADESDDKSKDPTNASSSPGSESVGLGSASESENTPSARPCRLLALSLGDDKPRGDIEQQSALDLGTLEKYHNIFPRGKTFHFTGPGSGYSSSSDDDESAGTKESSRRARKGRMDHKQLLKKLPGAKSVTFLPLYDHTEDRLVAGCFLWTSETGRMMTLDGDLSYLHAFGNSIISEVSRIQAAKNEAAKTTFIASMSHELRSPLHGILGATEFLMDTATDAYQSGLITSIMTCGKTLLDTLNHVLDYSKINKLGRAQMRRDAKHNKFVNLASDSDSMNLTAEVDLGVLVEEVVEAVTAGHAFKKQHGSALTAKVEELSGSSPLGKPNVSIQRSANKAYTQDDEGTVAILLDITPRSSWLVRTQPGALRRIIMNLLGNALKYTSEGFTAVSLRAVENAGSSMTDVYIRVVDSGKGITEEFMRDRLFVPFSQEDSFQPGTGLGLSIVKQIVDSLGGSVDVKSQQGVGTEIGVHLSLTPAEGHADEQGGPPDHEIISTANIVRGLHLVILDPSAGNDPPMHQPMHHISRLEKTIGEACASWFDMRVTRSATMEGTDADVFLYSEPPSVDYLLQANDGGPRSSPRDREVPMIIVCVNAEEAIRVSQNQSKALNKLGVIIEVIPQPCGPRKLAKVLNHCMRRVEEIEAKRKKEKSNTTSGAVDKASVEHSDDRTTHSGEDAESDKRSSQNDGDRTTDKRQKVEEEREHASQDIPLSAAVAFPSPPPIEPTSPSLQGKVQDNDPPAQHDKTNGDPSEPNAPHVLVVDDNKINLQLLVMFMKKLSYSYAEAENGLEALDKFKEAYRHGHAPEAADSQPGRRRFDYILMDISMPVMNGMDATKRIREFEKENKMERTRIIALTGLASAQAQNEAEAAGIDIFLPKPVKFAELRKLLPAR
ncbi:hypothetical protein LTR36_007565 [Oleoguttula mirabilis]|uniref:Uncharacterized protein n=1 Tax=Oleoguttula mirabilis TaxID=1507867 RepID=A0AAV9JU69_9PEZI|nr:hypothetical protein LTR36_007565 [Oleoguttula mirabilis]